MISQINSSIVMENMFPSKRPYMVKSIKTYAMAKLNYTPHRANLSPSTFRFSEDLS
jgi:hypothetical protein